MPEIVDEFGTVVPAAPADTAVGSKNRTLFGKYELGKILGCGAFAKVYHARDVRTGQSVAIKAISRNKVLKEGQAANVKREMSIMRRLRHAHIVRLFEVLATKTKIYFVIEFAKGGELFAKVAKGRFSEDLSRRYFQQLISAVGFCHSRGVFHRDLKPENLLLDENWDLKVTDFGLSAVADQIRADGLLHTLCGTPAYVAPEVLAKKGYDGAKVDVWSCGIILYVLNAGYLPFNDPNLMVMYRKIYRGEFRCPKWMSPDLKRFLCRLLDTNPDTRIKVDEIISDPWFKKDYKETKSSSEGLVLKERGESEQFLNAFDIISFSPSLDMSGLVAKAGGSTKCERFLTEVPPEEVIGRIEAAAKGERLTVVKKKDWGLKVEGRNGNFDMVLEIDRLTEKLVVVEVYRREIGSGSGHDIWNDKLRPQVSSLIYQPERRVASG